jgi:hypothetical protein
MWAYCCDHMMWELNILHQSVFFPLDIIINFVSAIQLVKHQFLGREPLYALNGKLQYRFIFMPHPNANISPTALFLYYGLVHYVSIA